MRYKRTIRLVFAGLLFFTSQNVSCQIMTAGFGLHIQSDSSDETFKSVLLFSGDFGTTGKYLYGFEVGFNLSGGVGEDWDYTDVINLGQYPEDITGEYAYNLVKFGIRGGYKTSSNIILTGTLGLNFLNEYQLRFDEFYILGDNGSYAIATDNNTTKPYAKGSISYPIGKFSPEIGYGNNGVSFGATLFF